MVESIPSAAVVYSIIGYYLHHHSELDAYYSTASPEIVTPRSSNPNTRRMAKAEDS